MNLWEQTSKVAVFCSKVTTTLSDQVVDLNCEGSASNKSSLSSSPSRYCLIHEFDDLDMPLAVAQLGHVQEHPQELQWTLSSSVELQWNLNRAPVRMELKFSSGTPVNPLQMGCLGQTVEKPNIQTKSLGGFCLMVELQLKGSIIKSNQI